MLPATAKLQKCSVNLRANKRLIVEERNWFAVEVGQRAMNV